MRTLRTRLLGRLYLLGIMLHHRFFVDRHPGPRLTED
jgi:hypothetical protein